jgi:hypothetical protein
MEYKSRSRAAENGNMLFLILIAAALFAALSYVVVQTSRTGSGDAEREKASLSAGEIMNYATALQASLTRLIIGGCDPKNVNFENGFDTLHVNPDARADKKCNIFDPPGGGVAAKKPDQGWATDPYFYYSGNQAISGIGITCAATECADIILVLRGISESLCRELNRMNSVKTPIPVLPTDTLQSCPYKGSFDCNGNGNVDVVFTAPELEAQHSICYRDTAHGLTFVHAILER